MVLIGPSEPARARLAKTFPVGPKWVYEPKWDGFRCLLFRHGDHVHLQSRSLKDLTRGFPEIVSAAQRLHPDSFILDGELAIPGSNGFSFDLLVNRLGLRTNLVRGLRLAIYQRLFFEFSERQVIGETSPLVHQFIDGAIH
jgi:ATP-dependent DNA ligase